MSTESLTISIDFRDIPVDQAVIPVLDHGFLFGDSVYEVVRTLGRQLLFFPEHAVRLRASAAGIALPVPHADRAYRDEMLRLVSRMPSGEAYIRLIITRGVGELELATESCRDQRSIMIAKPLKPWPKALYEDGCRLALVGVIRNSRHSTNPAYKTGNYLNNVLALDEARRSGASEAVMLNADGHVTECTTSNIFMVRDGTVETPRLGVGILSGITRAEVLAACESLGLVARELAFGAAELLAADEVFITSTTRDVMPVTSINDTKVGGGKVGPVTKRLMDAYQERCRLSLARS
jgi:branched-chain amino acid aminotransferase